MYVWCPLTLSSGAIASTEVKLKLQEFLLNKKEPGPGGLNHSFPQKCWWEKVHILVVHIAQPYSELVNLIQSAPFHLFFNLDNISNIGAVWCQMSSSMCWYYIMPHCAGSLWVSFEFWWMSLCNGLWLFLGGVTTRPWSRAPLHRATHRARRRPTDSLHC